MTTFAFANNFNIIVSNENNNYEITGWVDTGNIQCNQITPLENEITYGDSFEQTHSDCSKEQSKVNEKRWVSIDNYVINSVGTLEMKDCSDIQSYDSTKTSGVYTIKVNGINESVLCDMVTDGGGWTLVSYAGNIQTNKQTTTGQDNKYFQPLIFNYGVIDTNALKSRSSFSRFDMFKSQVKSSDEILFRRTDSPQNMLIFPIENTSFFGRDRSEGQFNITAENRNISYLKMTNNGNNNWKTVTNNVKWSYVNSNSGSYPGIDWNVSEGLNCDNCGANYNNALTHRSLIYWETLENNTGYEKQWFHASPLSLKDSTGPVNELQGFEFWYRKK